MNLNSGHLYSPAIFPDPPVYPSLEEDLACEVLVVGAGEAGALISHALHHQGIDTVLIDKRRVGGGTSSASTGLLQFESDKSLTDCIRQFGEHKGVRFYQLSSQALQSLGKTIAALEDDTEFETCGSLCFASDAKDAGTLETEYKTLLKYGFRAELWKEADIAERYSFRKPAGLFTPDNGQVNPYKLAHALVKSCRRKGMRVYEHTGMEAFRHDGNGPSVVTDGGRQIKARKIVFACGYEAEEVRPNPSAVLSSTYVAVTQPLQAEFDGWFGRSLIWETARPYVYMRTTADRRIICGGLDEHIADAGDRDQQLGQKTAQLLGRICELFPQYEDIRADYAWTSFFMRTRDGLPRFGEQDGFPDCFFLSGYGGNGSVLAAMGAEVVYDLILKGYHPDADLFAF